MCLNPEDAIRSIGDFFGFDGQLGYQGSFQGGGFVGNAEVVYPDGSTFIIPGDQPTGATPAQQALRDYMNAWWADHAMDYAVPTAIVGTITYNMQGVPSPTVVGIETYWQFWYDVATDWDLGRYNELATGVYAEQMGVYNPYGEKEFVDRHEIAP